MVDKQVSLEGKDVDMWRVRCKGKVLGIVKNKKAAKRLIRDFINKEKVKSYIIRLNNQNRGEGMKGGKVKW